MTRPEIRQLQAEAGERQQMVAILNEKTRENSKLKKENGQFLQRMADSGRNYEEKISCLSKEKVMIYFVLHKKAFYS